MSELTVEQLISLIEHAVDQALEDYFGDPDEGLQLRPEVEAKLRRSLERRKAGERGIPLEEVSKRLGIDLKE